MDGGGHEFDIKEFLKNLTQRPGVYLMLDAGGEIIYIGKAKNLKNRVSSYFRGQAASNKQQAMVAKIRRIEVTLTHTEGEALLLESQLIKQHQPRYNISLRDDKSYPYLLITQHKFPQLTFHRGAKKRAGRYFGPYPSASAVKETLRLLQKIFPVRQCEDSYFAARSRPCLQYQIQRCTGPCVNLIGEQDYKADVENTILFLSGQGGLLIDRLAEKMEAAAEKLEFEIAAVYRDQIFRLRAVLERHFLLGEHGDMDIIACAVAEEQACVQVFYVRSGQNLGNRQFFPKLNGQEPADKILQAFIGQYYLDKTVPDELLVSHALPEAALLSAMLSEQAKRKVAISHQLRGERMKWLQIALTNAENSLRTRLADRQTVAARFESLRRELGLAETPARLECFDISHTQGDYTVASCVVFGPEGAIKSDYRRFNIEGVAAGDDYAAMEQALTRRYKRLKLGEHPAPDILFIDGGKGQVGVAQKVLAALEINNVMIVGVSKGPDRKAGMEKIILAGNASPLAVTPGAAALLLIQQIRDEAHRFAITGHRQRRGKAKTQSALESIAGLGPKRRQGLLKQFGGLQGVANASVDALAGIEGVSRRLAQRIYDNFHQQDGS